MQMLVYLHPFNFKFQTIVMAKHRITENGHMMWFETDEEYIDYLNEKEKERLSLERAEKERAKRKIKRRAYGCLSVFILIIIIAVMGTCAEKKGKEKNSKDTTNSEQITKNETRTSQAAHKSAKQMPDDTPIIETAEETNPPEPETETPTEGEPAILTFDSNFKW